MKMSKMVMSLVALIASSAMAANTYYVSTSGSDSAGGSESAPFATVTKAVAVAVEGDTIIVDDGTYTAPNAADGIQVFKSVTIKSKNGPEKTTLKGGGSNRVITLQEGAAIEGFTITGGNETSVATTYPGWGGGVLISNGKIINCIVKGNKANTVKKGIGYGGGGVFVTSAGGLISRCIISDNESTVKSARGGGIAILGGVMENCIIINNKSQSIGGGVYARSNNPNVEVPPTIIRNCTILNNSTVEADGGGVYLHKNENPHYVHLYDTIVFNTQNSIDVAHVQPECENYVTNLCSSATYGFNHILASKEMFSDFENGDYMPLAESGLVDASFGETTTSDVDIEGNERLVGSRMDIGAVEFQNKYKLTIASRYNDRGTVSIEGKDGNSVFVEPGEEVKVVASVLGAVPFAGWTLVKGGHFDEALLSSSEITFKVNCNVELVANFVREFEVSNLESLLSAIDEARDGDQVIVSDGEYIAPNEPDGIKVTKAIIIKSENGPNKTTLKGGGSHRVITLKNGAWVEGFTITGGNEKNLATTALGEGGGVCMVNSTLINCIVHSNRTSAKRYGGGAGILMTGGGLISGCIITNNVAENKDPEGGGVRMLGGILENSLITGNTATYRGGGVFVSMNSKDPIIIRNCTIVKNTPNANAGNGLYVKDSNAPEFRLIDTIVYGNLSSNEKDVNFYQAGPKSIVNLCSTTSYGTGFITGSDSIFVDYAGGDYALAAGSVCIDAASGEGTAIDKDVAGNPRVNGKSMDIGAYEFVPKVGSLTVQYDNSVIAAAQVSPLFGKIENVVEDITFTAPDGYYTNDNEDYYGITGWEYTVYDVNGDILSAKSGDGREVVLKYDSNNGEILFKWKTTKYFKLTANPSKEDRGNVYINSLDINALYVQPGQEITVAARSEGSARFSGWYCAKRGVLSEAQLSSASITFPVNCSVDLVAKFPVAFYVATSGSDENDGLNWTTAFASLTNAIEKTGDGDTITVGDGEYIAPDAPDGIKVLKAITVKSQNGPKKATLKGGGNNRVLTMTNNSWVEGFSITGGIEKDLATILQGYGGGVAMRNSTLVNCIVFGNKVSSKNGGRGGGGIMVGADGLISRCIIRDNSTDGKDPKGGGVKLHAGVLENSLVVNNFAGYMSGGVDIEAWVIDSPGEIRNCTVVNNTTKISSSTANVRVDKKDGHPQIVNTIICKGNAGDGEINYTGGENYVINLCASTAFGKYIKNGTQDDTLASLLTSGPKFKDYEKGDFRLSAGSPCINNAYGEATTKTDLAGKKRVIGKAMDIGCYEFSSGFSVVVR